MNKINFAKFLTSIYTQEESYSLFRALSRRHLSFCCAARYTSNTPRTLRSRSNKKKTAPQRNCALLNHAPRMLNRVQLNSAFASNRLHLTHASAPRPAFSLRTRSSRAALIHHATLRSRSLGHLQLSRACTRTRRASPATLRVCVSGG